jgi:ribosomal-protein-alanine N-acetyltransferase
MSVTNTIVIVIMTEGGFQPACIRQFEPSDMKAVIAINRTSLPENYPDQFFLGLHYHAPKGFLVAIVDDCIVGYIMCRIERGISSFGRFPVKKGHIVSIAVADECRHHGVGTKLIEAGMEGMASYKRVLKGYYRDGEDAYLMIKKHASNTEEVAVHDTQN